MPALGVPVSPLAGVDKHGGDRDENELRRERASELAAFHRNLAGVPVVTETAPRCSVCSALLGAWSTVHYAPLTGEQRKRIAALTLRPCPGSWAQKGTGK